MASVERASASPSYRSGLTPISHGGTQPALPAREPVDQLFETIVEASFDLIEELGDITLNLYLHAPHDDQPILFVRRPFLRILTPSQNFRLMHTVTMLSNGRKSTAAFRHGDLDGHYVRTTGQRSDGLFVFGGIQRKDIAQRITSICRAFAQVLHQFHLDDDPDEVHVVAPTVMIQARGSDIHVDATVREAGQEWSGTAVASSPNEAVARAVMDAVGPGYQFDEIRTLDVGRRSAVLAVLRDERGLLRLGLAISAGDLVRTTALATRRAIQSALAET